MVKLGTENTRKIGSGLVILGNSGSYRLFWVNYRIIRMIRIKILDYFGYFR